LQSFNNRISGAAVRALVITVFDQGEGSIDGALGVVPG